MKIQNTLLNNLLQNNALGVFVEGSVFKGRIEEIKDNSIIINVTDVGLLEATLDNNGEFSVGDKVLFLVKSVDNNKIYIKPLEVSTSNVKDSFNLYNGYNPIVKLLKEMSFEHNEMTVGLVEKLMEHNLPINKDIVKEGIKILEKLVQLIDITEGEGIILSDSNILNDLNIESIENIEELDIKYLFVSDENTENNLSKLVKDFVRNNFDLNNMDKLIKITSFLVKSNLTPSLRNIKYIRDLDNDPMKFIKEIQKIFNKHSFVDINKTTNNSVENIDNRNTFKVISIKEDSIDELKELVSQIIKETSEDLEGIKEIESRLDFLSKLNNNLSFTFFPIEYDLKDKLQGLLSLIKEKNKRGIGDKVNIFINLNTNNLGNIKIFCNLVGNCINIKMYIREEDLELFKSTEKKLIEKILTIGYSVKGINYITDKDFSLIDSLVSRPSSSYILDLKV